MYIYRAIGSRGVSSISGPFAAKDRDKGNCSYVAADQRLDKTKGDNEMF